MVSRKVKNIYVPKYLIMAVRNCINVFGLYGLLEVRQSVSVDLFVHRQTT